ncbi:hypothetical protein BJ508DRAFT_380275 [Ascobolus immersus RN42]|uniref:F-box domain-containing protein n=1 Tax=Ascobolus immersus RN42 TaxID=1160509 RepID=A0A3N4HMI4_ASCIM|nr:hypothetical protein BJ508DRAFT_380275 [Ascobolus immersus RN42]
MAEHAYSAEYVGDFYTTGITSVRLAAEVKAQKALAPQAFGNATRGILACPQELIDQILADLTIRDFLGLRLVCLDYYRYFTHPGIVAYAHCLYFPRSSALLGGGSNAQYRSHVMLECGTPELTAADFEAAHRRARRWQKGTPTSVQFFDDVVKGSVVNSPNAIIVSEAEGLLIYQRSVGVLVVVDLNGHLRSGFPREQVVDLRALLGPCILQTSEKRSHAQPSQQIQMRLNKGTLLVIGERHQHELGGTLQRSSILKSRLFHPFTSEQAHCPDIRQSTQHTLCAVISLRPQDRGQVIHAWFDPDPFILATSHNQFYSLIEFDMLNNRIKGLVFPEKTARKRSSYLRGSTSPPGLGARFEILKRREYPTASVFNIAADDAGQHFFVGYADRGTNIPVIEVHTVPKLQSDGSYSSSTIIKRVRLLHGMMTSLPGINRHRTSFKFRFENIIDPTEGAWEHVRGYEEDGDGLPGIKHLHLPKPTPEDRKYEKIKVVMSGAFSPDDPNREVIGIEPGHFVDSLSWEVNTKPSPRKPSTALDYNRSGGQHGVADEEFDSDGNLIASCCFLDKEGNYNSAEAYPTPTVYLLPNLIKNIALHSLYPPGPRPGLQRQLARGELIEYPQPLWRFDSPQRASLCTIFLTPIRPSTLDTSRPYPPIPGKDDSTFIPPTTLLLATNLHAFTTGQWTAHSSFTTKPDPVASFLSYLANPMLMTSLRAAIGLPNNEALVQRVPSVGAQPRPKTHTFLPSPIDARDGTVESLSVPVPKTLGMMDKDRRWLVYTLPRQRWYESKGWDGQSQGELGQYDGQRICVVRFDD